MAESSLSIGLPELIEEVGFSLGHGRADHSVAQLAEIMSVIQSGIRRVYYPPAVHESVIGHDWSWLRPTTTMATVDGTGDYDMPDDFGTMVGGFHYAADQYEPSIPIISIGTMLERRSAGVVSGPPRFAAIRHKASTGVGGQRQEVLFWPEPDAVWTLSYGYAAYSGALSETYPYPLGGMKMAELYIESCLAVAESRLNDEIGNHTAQYTSLLIDAVARDKSNGARIYGPMGHRESECSRRRHGDTGGTYPITFYHIDGTEY